MVTVILLERLATCVGSSSWQNRVRAAPDLVVAMR